MRQMGHLCSCWAHCVQQDRHTGTQSSLPVLEASITEVALDVIKACQQISYGVSQTLHRFSDFFQTRWKRFSKILHAHCTFIPTPDYKRSLILSRSWTKFCHIKCNHTVNFYISLDC